MCRHIDGTVIEFLLAGALDRSECQNQASPVTMIGLPLSVRGKVIGSILLYRREAEKETDPSSDEFRLIVGIAQQLGLSIENARLYQGGAGGEKSYWVSFCIEWSGAQEAERQRIARELPRCHRAISHCHRAGAAGCGKTCSKAIRPSRLSRSKS